MRKAFWKTGAVLLGLLLFVVIPVQFIAWTRAVESAETDAKAVLRAEHQKLDWVFTEWERCNTGQGDYAKNSYLTKEQCDMALVAQAKIQGNEVYVRRVLDEQQFQLNDAAKKVQPSWPLSIMADPIFRIFLYLQD